MFLGVIFCRQGPCKLINLSNCNVLIVAISFILAVASLVIFTNDLDCQVFNRHFSFLSVIWHSCRAHKIKMFCSLGFKSIRQWAKKKKGPAKTRWAKKKKQLRPDKPSRKKTSKHRSEREQRDQLIPGDTKSINCYFPKALVWYTML